MFEPRIGYFCVEEIERGQSVKREEETTAPISCLLPASISARTTPGLASCRCWQHAQRALSAHFFMRLRKMRLAMLPALEANSVGRSLPFASRQIVSVSPSSL